MEGKHLHPRRDRSGRYWFDPFEVACVASKRGKLPEAELAAVVFQGFDEGKTLIELVRMLRQPPQFIRELYDHYVLSLEDGHRAKMRRAKRVEVEGEKIRQELSDERLDSRLRKFLAQ